MFIYIFFSDPFEWVDFQCLAPITNHFLNMIITYKIYCTNGVPFSVF